MRQVLRLRPAVRFTAKVGRTSLAGLGREARPTSTARSPAPGTRSSSTTAPGRPSWARSSAAKDEAQRAKDAGELPVVLVVDSITCEWESLKDWASDRAKTTSANRAKLQQRPERRGSGHHEPVE